MLTSKLALITGAGSGIGKAACIALAREGAKVVACDINYQNAKQTADHIGGKFHSASEMDVKKLPDVERVLSDIVRKYGRPPNIVVNCAGITRDEFITRMSESDFDDVINVNLKGTYIIIQSCAKLLIEHSMSGSIINIASIVGKTGNIGQCNYAASKAGVEIMTKSAAMELGKFGIRCNSILPGFIETPMIETVPDKVLDMFKKRVALGRLGKAEEVAEVILFLASDRSSYVNGTSVEVTGGL